MSQFKFMVDGIFKGDPIIWGSWFTLIISSILVVYSCDGFHSPYKYAGAIQNCICFKHLHAHFRLLWGDVGCNRIPYRKYAGVCRLRCHCFDSALMVTIYLAPISNWGKCWITIPVINQAFQHRFGKVGSWSQPLQGAGNVKIIKDFQEHLVLRSLLRLDWSWIDCDG